MKGMIKYFVVYLIGLFCVFAVAWRYDSFYNKTSLNSSVNDSYVVNNE